MRWTGAAGQKTWTMNPAGLSSPGVQRPGVDAAVHRAVEELHAAAVRSHDELVERRRVLGQVGDDGAAGTDERVRVCSTGRDHADKRTREKERSLHGRNTSSHDAPSSALVNTVPSESASSRPSPPCLST